MQWIVDSWCVWVMEDIGTDLETPISLKCKITFSKYMGGNIGMILYIQ